MEIRRDDLDAVLLGHAGWNAAAPPRPKSVSSASTATRLYSSLRTEIAAERLHHVVVGRIDSERPFIAADARQLGDLRA